MIGYCVVVFHCVVLFCFEVDFFVESCFVEDGSVGLDCNVLPISCNVDCVVFCCSVETGQGCMAVCCVETGCCIVACIEVGVYYCCAAL